MSLVGKCILILKYLVCEGYDEILMKTVKFSDNLRTTENGLDSGIDKVLESVLRFRTSPIDLMNSERVSTLTSSIVTQRLVYSSLLESMTILKLLCHGYETGSLYF